MLNHGRAGESIPLLEDLRRRVPAEAHDAQAEDPAGRGMGFHDMDGAPEVFFQEFRGSQQIKVKVLLKQGEGAGM